MQPHQPSNPATRAAERRRQRATYLAALQAIAPRHGLAYTAADDAAILASDAMPATAKDIGHLLTAAKQRRLLLRQQARRLGSAAASPDSSDVAPKETERP